MKDKSEITFFSEADMFIRKDGKKIVASEYPIWYNSQVVDEITEDIARDEYALKQGFIKESQIPVVRKRIDEMKVKLNSIEESMPKFTDKQKDAVNSAINYLGKEISERMFSRSDMMKGVADTHQEAQRMIKPSITVTAEIADLVKACNVRVTDGKISRDGAAKVWKICRKSLDEMSDTELLRRD